MKNILQTKMSIVLVLAVLMMAFSGCGKTTEAPNASQQETAPVITEPERQLKTDIQTVLLMVLDSYDISGTSGSYRNGNRADFMLLMVIEEQLGKVTALQLNPDTVVPFSAPGTSETVEIPVGQVYSYGSGGSDSCLNLTKTVSKFLDGVPVDHYLTFTMDSVGIVSDMLGGVVLAAPEGAPDEVPVTLKGSDAVTFFGTRSENDMVNEAHMEHQRQFMMGLYEPFMVSAQNDDFLTKLTLQLGERMATDLTLSQMMLMFETLAAYEMDENVITMQGTSEILDGEFRFYADETSRNQILDVLFAQ